MTQEKDRLIGLAADVVTELGGIVDRLAKINPEKLRDAMGPKYDTLCAWLDVAKAQLSVANKALMIPGAGPFVLGKIAKLLEKEKHDGR